MQTITLNTTHQRQMRQRDIDNDRREYLRDHYSRGRHWRWTYLQKKIIMEKKPFGQMPLLNPRPAEYAADTCRARSFRHQECEVVSVYNRCSMCTCPVGSQHDGVPVIYSAGIRLFRTAHWILYRHGLRPRTAWIFILLTAENHGTITGKRTVLHSAVIIVNVVAGNAVSPSIREDFEVKNACRIMRRRHLYRITLPQKYRGWWKDIE